ncbi:MAG: 5-formyltetrahydrofolate cyclo-ligase [Lachnospiraceae bacterium]
MEQKKTILRASLKQKRALLHEEGLHKSEDAVIAKKAIAFLKQQKPSLVLCYYAIGAEVATEEIIQYCLDQNIRLALPVTLPKGVIEFYEITDLNTCVKGAYGIMEPPRKALVSKKELQSVKTIVFLPGLGFDETGGRIGYGGGYYDRFLANYLEITKVALAYSCQIVPEIPREPTDVMYDVCITPLL